MIDPNKLLDYGYLNLDTREFVSSQTELVEQIGKGGNIQSFPSKDYSQILIAASKRSFTRCEAIITCQKLTGMYKGKQQ